MKTPDIKLDFSKLEKSNRNSNWQKAVFGALVLSLLVFLAANAYLYFRPLSADIQTSIDSEAASANISFDKKTVEMLNQRQQPPANTQTTGGKNPFTPF